MKSPIRKNMGKKNCEFTAEIRKEILRIFMDMEQSKVSMIFLNSEFGYWNITVERPLRLRVLENAEIPAQNEKGNNLFKKESELEEVRTAVNKACNGTPLNDWNAFAKATNLKKGQLKKIRPYITAIDLKANLV